MYTKHFTFHLEHYNIQLYVINTFLKMCTKLKITYYNLISISPVFLNNWNFVYHQKWHCRI